MALYVEYGRMRFVHHLQAGAHLFTFYQLCDIEISFQRGTQNSGLQTVPGIQCHLLGIPSPEKVLRLAIIPFVRVGSARRGQELFVTGELRGSIDQMQCDSVLSAGLLHSLCAVFSGFLVHFQSARNLMS